MWDAVQKPAQHIARYSTLLGQTWYLLLFIFRLIVVATIAAEAYKDEQSNFHCSTKVVGCESVCYNRFAKISHIRFWAFQILALASPVIIFHFYALFIEGRIEKCKDAEEKLKNKHKKDIQDGKIMLNHSSSEIDHLKKRIKKVGSIKSRTRYHEKKLLVVHFTNSIAIGYFFSVLFRIFFEFIFLYWAYELFTFAVYETELYEGVVISKMGRVNNFFDLFWLTVPQLYRCSGNAVRWACNQHMLPGNKNAYVPCWVSRPWEKTIILRYMNTLSLIGFILCCAELLQLVVKFCRSYIKHKNKTHGNEFEYKLAPSEDSSVKSITLEKPIQSKQDNYFVTNEKVLDETRKYATLPATLKTKPRNSENTFEEAAKLRKKLSELDSQLDANVVKATREATPMQVRLRKTKRNKKTVNETAVDGPMDETEPKVVPTKQPKLSKLALTVAAGTKTFHDSSQSKYKKPYAKMHSLEHESFSVEDDDDDDEEDSDSSESMERNSVSIHSSNQGFAST